MSYKIKQLIPAEPGWRVLFDDADDDDHKEQPVIGWALVRYDFKDMNGTKDGKEEEIFPVCPGPYAGASTAVIAVSCHGSIPDCAGYTVVGVLRPGQAADSLADVAVAVRAREQSKRAEKMAELDERLAGLDGLLASCPPELEKRLLPTLKILKKLRALKTLRDQDDEDDTGDDDKEEEKLS